MLNHLSNILEKDAPKFTKEIFKKRKPPPFDHETAVKKIKLYLSEISDRYDVVLHKSIEWGFGLTLVDEPLIGQLFGLLKIRSVGAVKGCQQTTNQQTSNHSRDDSVANHQRANDVEPGDVVTVVGGREVLGWPPESVVRLFRDVEPGQFLLVTVWRMGAGLDDKSRQYNGEGMTSSIYPMPGSSVTTSSSTSSSTMSSSVSGSLVVGIAGGAVARTTGVNPPNSVPSGHVINFYLHKSFSYGFGFVLGNCKHQHRVAEVNGDGDVKLLLFRNDRLLGVGRVRIDHLSHDQLVCLLQRFPAGRRLQFTIVRENEDSSASGRSGYLPRHQCCNDLTTGQTTAVASQENSTYINFIPSSVSMPSVHLQQQQQRHQLPMNETLSYVFHVRLAKSVHGSLGFRLMGGLEEACQVYIGEVVEGGSADLSGQVASGDVICSVNGHNCEMLRHCDVVKLLDTCHHSNSTVVDLELCRMATLVAIDYETAQEILLADAVQQGEPCGIVRLPTHQSQLSIGDRIIAVESRNVIGWPHRSVASLIQSLARCNPNTPIMLSVCTGGPRPLVGLKTIKYDLPDLGSSNYIFMNGRSDSTSPNYESLSDIQMPATSYYLSHHSADNNMPTIHSHSQSSSSVILGVDLTKGDSGFGFSIQGGREMDNSSLTVMCIADNAPRALYEAVQIGDEILEINGVDATDLSHSEAISLIHNSGERLTMLLRRDILTQLSD